MLVSAERRGRALKKGVDDMPNDETQSPEIFAMLRVIAAAATRTILEVQLVSAEAYCAYRACDGKKTQQQIAAEAKRSEGWISETCSTWRQLGLVFDDPDTGRPKALFDPQVLGINEPPGVT